MPIASWSQRKYKVMTYRSMTYHNYWIGEECLQKISKEKDRAVTPNQSLKTNIHAAIKRQKEQRACIIRLHSECQTVEQWPEMSDHNRSMLSKPDHLKSRKKSPNM